MKPLSSPARSSSDREAHHGAGGMITFCFTSSQHLCRALKAPLGEPVLSITRKWPCLSSSWQLLTPPSAPGILSTPHRHTLLGFHYLPRPFWVKFLCFKLQASTFSPTLPLTVLLPHSLFSRVTLMRVTVNTPKSFFPTNRKCISISWQPSSLFSYL